jgi:hypothetical protein
VARTGVSAPQKNKLPTLANRGEWATRPLKPSEGLNGPPITLECPLIGHLCFFAVRLAREWLGREILRAPARVSVLERLRVFGEFCASNEVKRYFGALERSPKIPT